MILPVVVAVDIAEVAEVGIVVGTVVAVDIEAAVDIGMVAGVDTGVAGIVGTVVDMALRELGHTVPYLSL
ncbi:MAG: hypothetical protein KAU14_06765 [Thermoplasmata archaeon]|nr:hypothetical protein [Thermoplasmata archaeon]